jgi:alpha-amylase/alpha-mannosidase (GH57 family)
MKSKEIDEILNLPVANDIILGAGKIISKKTNNSDDNFSNLTAAEKVFLFIDMLEGQVNNGGFDQFFNNSSGDYTYEALNAYKEIGADKTVEIVSKAIGHFPVLPVPKDTGVRRKIMGNLDNQVSIHWGKLDDEFYKYEDDIVGLLVDYLKKNRAQIG